MYKSVSKHNVRTSKMLWRKWSWLLKMPQNKRHVDRFNFIPFTNRSAHQGRLPIKQGIDENERMNKQTNRQTYFQPTSLCTVSHQSGGICCVWHGGLSSPYYYVYYKPNVTISKILIIALLFSNWVEYNTHDFKHIIHFVYIVYVVKNTYDKVGFIHFANCNAIKHFIISVTLHITCIIRKHKYQ